jgi:hypothetical protein
MALLPLQNPPLCYILPNVNGSVIIGNVSGIMLSIIIKNLSINDLLASSKSIAGRISIMPNSQITEQDFQNASLLQNQFVQNGLRAIISNSDNIAPAECRYQPNRGDNIS